MRDEQQRLIVELDGSHGEGGGQILRSALTLSMITGIPFRLERIRARRSKPGLLRQHLTAVQAAAQICGASVEGASLGSLVLNFVPGAIQGGEYQYSIGTAGSCTLVLQTVLPTLWFAERPSVLTVSGGTHNPAAPPFDFLVHAWLPQLRKMGVDMQIELLRHGFFPAGGGQVRARVTPVQTLQSITLCERGAPLKTTSIAVVAGVPAEVAKREVATVQARLPESQGELRVLPSSEGPGNVLLVLDEYENVSELMVAFGERGLSAEKVAETAVKEVLSYRQSGAAVGEHLADQLVLPMALAGGGRFTTTTLSSHLRTNIEVIQKFLPLTFEVFESAGRVQVGVARPV